MGKPGGNSMTSVDKINMSATHFRLVNVRQTGHFSASDIF
jgi:hypothetical protein